VWAYANAIVDLHCAQGSQCELSAYDPEGHRPLWTVTTGGLGFVLNPANPDLPDTEPLSSPQVDDQVAGRPLMPELMGLPDDGKVRVVDTAAGRVVRTVTPEQNQRARHGLPAVPLIEPVFGRDRSGSHLVPALA
jgi:outer membrane protein assembly factor BamB